MKNTGNVKEMSILKKMLFLLAIFATNIIMMGDYFTFPTLNILYEKFADHIFWVNFFVSGSFLIGAIVSPFVGKLCIKYSKKTLMVAGGIIATVPAVLFLAVDNIYFMCLMKTIYSVGYAILQVVAVSFLTEVYPSEETRASIMGYFNASVSAFGVIMSTVAGYMSMVSMEFAYRAYLIFIPITILFVFALPKIKPEAAQSVDTVRETGEKGRLSVDFWFMIITFTVFSVALEMVYYFLSTYIVENEIGDAVYIGNTNSIRIAACFFIALVFGTMLKKIGKSLIIICYTLATISFAVLATVPSGTVVRIFYTLLGMSFTIAYVYVYTMAPVIAGRGKQSDAIAILAAMFSAACFLNTYCAGWIEKLFNTTRFTPVLWVCTAMGVICIVASVFSVIRTEKSETEVQ